jgi:ABC-type uncharacterized transport system substrate-binding protein
VKRREFITLLSGAAAWPLAARAQQDERVRRVAVVMQYVETDPQGQLRAAAFREGLEKAGWVSGRNISVDYLWGVLDSEWTRGITEHLRQRVPDVIAINSSIGLRAIESTAPGVPIVFIAVSEPVAQGEPRASRWQHDGFLQSGTDAWSEMARSAQADRTTSDSYCVYLQSQ